MKTYKITIEDATKITYKVIGISYGGNEKEFDEFNNVAEAKRAAKEYADRYRSSNRMSSKQYYIFEVVAYRGYDKIGLKASYSVNDRG